VSPDRPAAVNADTGETLSYAELDARSNRLAHFLARSGLRRGDHIALLMENNLRYFEVVWAALRSGLYVTPVNWHLTPGEAAYIIDDCGAQAVIGSAHLADLARAVPALTPKVRDFLAVDGQVEGWASYETALAGCPATPLDQEWAGYFMLYSSGTTGRPKGIVKPLPQATIDQAGASLGAFQSATWGFGPDTVYLSPAPLYHAAPLNFVLATQSLGGTVVMMPRFDEVRALAAIETFAVTHSQWVPTMFSRMLKLSPAAREAYDLSSHRFAIHAGAPCPPGVKRQMLEWWGPIIYEYYGGSEGVGLTHVTPHEWLERPGSVGRAVFGVLHICGADDAELPPGETGLVYFENEAASFAYHGDEEKTASARHPAHPTWACLGDIGHLDQDGFLFLTDRASFVIISGGVNIYPQEIEDVLILHPSVDDVAVIGTPHPDMGEQVTAVVQLAPGIAAGDRTRTELTAFARTQLSGFKVPRQIDFTEALPRLPTGKLYKRLIKSKYWGETTNLIV